MCGLQSGEHGLCAEPSELRQRPGLFPGEVATAVLSAEHPVFLKGICDGPQAVLFPVSPEPPVGTGAGSGVACWGLSDVLLQGARPGEAAG